MATEAGRLVGRVSQRFKRRFYGKTFRCPVCHLELAHADLDAQGLVVCPLCGVVMHVEDTYGHSVPVVNDVEVFRPQPKSRAHPLAAHLPIGLFPLAFAGAGLLLLASLANLVSARLPSLWADLMRPMPLVADAVLMLLLISVASSTITVSSGLWDWKHRYRGRPYRVISLKIAFSVVFLLCGIAATLLHGLGAVFAPESGLVDFSTPIHLLAVLAYFGLLAGNLAVISTLGHVGGNLVFGK